MPVMDKETRTAWLEDRKTYLGGTDIAAIIGVHPYKSTMEVYLEKTGQAEPKPSNAAMEMGNILEPVVAQLYTERTGVQLELAALVRSPEYPFLAVNPDYWIPGGNALVECKTAGAHMAKYWGDEGTDLIPIQYLIQCHWQLVLTGFDYVDVAVLIGGQDFRVYRVMPDVEIHDQLMDAAISWWNEHVVGNTPPPISGSSSDTEWLKRKYSSDNGEIINATEDIECAISELQAARIARIDAEKREAEAENIIKEFMGENSVLESNAGRFTWKAAKPSQVTDWKELTKMLQATPDQIREFSVTKPGSRRFLTPFKEAK